MAAFLCLEKDLKGKNYTVGEGHANDMRRQHDKKSYCNT
jgi:hypothetical protein